MRKKNRQLPLNGQKLAKRLLKKPKKKLQLSSEEKGLDKASSFHIPSDSGSPEAEY